MHEEHPTQPIGKPTGEQRTRKSDEVVKHRHALADRPSDPPQHRYHTDPYSPRLPAFRAQQILFFLEPVLLALGVYFGLRFAALEDLRIPQESDEEIFHSDMPVDDASNHDRRDGETVCDFSYDWRCAVEGWGVYLLAGVVVDDDTGDEVHGDVAALEEGESFGEVSRVAKLRDKAEECDLE